MKGVMLIPGAEQFMGSTCSCIQLTVGTKEGNFLPIDQLGDKYVSSPELKWNKY